MAGKKISQEQLAGNTEVFADLLTSVPSKKTPSAVQAAAEETKPEKDVHLTMLVKESTRKAWKQFFIEHDLNTTQGIEIAMRHLIDDIENKKYKLSKGGLSKIIDDQD
ncbi:hypothetical protein [Treponema sp.]|uniref:hypothetical protein n=1 Tax=Treponema sp. TaxID=166 RepID=UPI00298DCF03|nr:hypothetical protein [Treponema sp.]MCQ2241655.1 hypothetical protein [Treponema sp.]